MAIGSEDGRRYESEFEMLSSPDMSSTMPSSAPETATGEVNPELGTQVAQAFDPEGSDYDMDSALAAGLTADETGHWPSRDPNTGMILKGRGHPTFDKTIKGEEEAGYEIINKDGRYYSFPKGQPQSMTDETPMGLGTTAMMRKEQFVGTRSGEGGGGLSRETITGAAIKTGKEIHTGPNHSLIAVKLPDKVLDKAVDGFMTSSGRFVTREEAAKIVKQNGQERSEFYKEKRSGFSLGTEDLKDLLPGSSKAWQQYLGE